MRLVNKFVVDKQNEKSLVLVTQTEMSATLSTPEMKRSVPLVRSSAFFSSSSQRRHRRRQRLYFEVIRDDDNDLVSERDVLLSWIYTRFYVHFVGISVEVFTCSKRANTFSLLGNIFNSEKVNNLREKISEKFILPL